MTESVIALAMPKQPQRRFAIISVLESLGIGAAVVDFSGQILQSNQLLKIQVDKLRPEISLDRFLKTFQEHVVASGFDTRLEEDSRSFLIKTPGKRPMATFCVKMLGSRKAKYLLIAVYDMDEIMNPRSSTLRAAFGLTRAEAAVAKRAAQGMSCPKIAAQLGVAPGTVRAQLKAVFAKTHTNRQSELTAALARVSILSQASEQVVLDSFTVADLERTRGRSASSKLRSC